MKRDCLLFASIAILVISAVSCQKDAVISNTEYTPHELVRTKSDAEMTKAVNNFAFDLLKEGYEFNHNVLYSPASLSMALSMALDGADGQTFDEMRSVLGFSGMTVDDIDSYNHHLINYLPTADKSVEFSLANSVWINKGFAVKIPFCNQVTEFYDAEVSDIELGTEDALKAINGWCNENTHGMIPEMFQRSPDGLLLLLNALFFNAEWKTSAEEWGEMAFRGEDGTVSSLPRIVSRWNVPYYSNDVFEMISIPLGKEGLFSFTVLLPKGDMPVNDVLNSCSAIWKIAKDKMEVKEIHVELPKFSISTSGNLNGILQAMGMERAFTGAAEFPFIASPSPAISEVLQNSKIDLSEKGIKAAAATAVMYKYLQPTVYPEPVSEFIADHPFIFTIEENETGVILFAGVKSSAD